MRTIRLLETFGLLLVATAAIGCGDEAKTMSITTAEPADRQPAAGSTIADVASEKGATAGRKIIYNASVDLVTEDLTKLDASLARLVASEKAYIADSQRSGSAGSRQGTWKVRVPVDGYDAFVKGVVLLGELVSMKAESQDVTEEYVDLDARQAAKKVEEARLLKHLTDSTGKLDEILTVERELSRVRGEVERMQGRLRRVGQTFAASIESLQHFGEAVLIAVVAIVPWLPLIALGVGFAVWVSRRRGR